MSSWLLPRRGGGGIPGLCGWCGRRPQQWGDVLCAACDAAARASLLWRRRVVATGRWAGAGMIEGLVGVGAGALALWPVSAGARPLPTVGVLMVAALLATLLALMVFRSGCWLMRPLVRRWELWAAADGVEVLAGWLAATGLVLAAGYVPGVLAVTGLITGSLAALAQGRLALARTPRATAWLTGSALIWLVAGGAGLAVELAQHGSLLGVIAGAGLGRMLHAALAGPILAWVVVPRVR